jgi:hypothetical protein
LRVNVRLALDLTLAPVRSLVRAGAGAADASF